jgi:hypothetical protein
VGNAAGRIGAGSFGEAFVAPWTSAYAIAVGVIALALFAYLDAVYLTFATSDARCAICSVPSLRPPNERAHHAEQRRWELSRIL